MASVARYRWIHSLNYPTHMSLHPAGAKAYRLEIDHPDAGVFLQRKGEAQMFPVRETTMVSCGDTVVLGTLNGPPFTIDNDAPAASPASVQGDLGGRLGQEVRSGARPHAIEKAASRRLPYVEPRTHRQLQQPNLCGWRLTGLLAAVLAGSASCPGLAYMLYQNLSQ